MELSYEENLQLENSREHLRVVLSNLRIASEELNKVYTETIKAKEHLLKIKNDVQTIRDSGIQISKDLLNRKEQLDKKEVSLSDKEKELTVIQEDIDNDIRIKKSKLRELDKSLTTIDKQLSDTVRLKTEEIKNLSNRISFLIGEIENNEKEIKEKHIIQKKLKDEITGLNIGIQEEKIKIEKEKKSLNQELKSIKDNIESEKEKIVLPKKMIDEENEKLEAKRKDLVILAARLKKQFIEQNPRKNIPIELQ